MTQFEFFAEKDQWRLGWYNW